MECPERQYLHEQWVSEHDRLCQALDKYEQKLAIVPIEQFQQLKTSSATARHPCNRALDVLHRHVRVHGC